MVAWKKGSRGLRLLLPMGVSALALFAFGRAPAAQMSEIDAFQRAVNTQSPQDALAFIDRFGTSHLVPDLIDLLEPDVAVQVCSSLGDGPPSARNACERMTAAIATAPAAGAAAPTPAPMQISAPAVPGAASTAPADGPPSGESLYLIPPVLPDPAAGSVTADDGVALDSRHGSNRETDGSGSLADSGGSGSSGGGSDSGGSGGSGSGGSGGSSGGGGSGSSGGDEGGGSDDGGDDGGGDDGGGDDGGGPAGGALGGLGNAVGGALGGLGNAVGGALGGLGNGLGNGGD